MEMNQRNRLDVLSKLDRVKDNGQYPILHRIYNTSIASPTTRQKQASVSKLFSQEEKMSSVGSLYNNLKKN